MMPECMPPCPGKGMSITISIDLSDFLGGPADYYPTKPSCSLPETPVGPKQPCDPEKLTYFNENNRPKEECAQGFRAARDNVMSNHSNKHSFSDDKDEKKDKEGGEKDG